MQLANQLELCLHKQTQIVASAACRVGSQEFHSWIASLPLVSLLFIVIPTPFLNFFRCKSRGAYYEQTTLTSILRALILKIQYIIYVYKGYMLHQKVN